MRDLRGAFGPAELIFLAGLVSLGIGLGSILPAAAFIAVGTILMVVGWRWQEPTAVAEAPVAEPLTPDVALAELGYQRAA